MATKDNATLVPSGNEYVKQCCARLYESDLTRFLLGDSFHPGGLQMTGRLGRTLGLSPASRVLDVACGNGTAAIFLAKKFGCKVFGIDYGDQSVAAARSLAQSEHIDTRVQFERGDAETLPFPDGSFDAVICECAFCTFPNKAASAREFFRVLRHGGRVGISDLTRETVLPQELDGLLAWLACIGDAQTVEGYTHFLQDAGFLVDGIEQQNYALEDMVNQIRIKLLGAEIMTGLNKLQLPGIDLGAAKQMAGSAMAAVKRGQLGYVLICATKPDSG
jgi:arsenite methyltransferase